MSDDSSTVSAASMDAIATRIGWIVIASSHLETLLGYTHQRVVVGSKLGELGALGRNWATNFEDVERALTPANTAATQRLLTAIRRAGDDWKRRNDVIHAHWWEIDPTGIVATSRFKRDGNHSMIPWDVHALKQLTVSLQDDAREIIAAIRALDDEENVHAQRR